MQANDNKEVLQELYSGIRKGQEVIIEYLPSTKEVGLRRKFQKHIDNYMEIKRQAIVLMDEFGGKVRIRPVGRVKLWGSEEVGTLTGMDEKMTVEKMIEGSSMCATNMNMLANAYPHIDRRVKELIFRVISVERNYAAELQKHLGVRDSLKSSGSSQIDAGA